MEKKEKDGQTKYDAKIIKKMNRRILLEVLVEQGKRIEELETSNASLRQALDTANARLDNLQINPEDLSALVEASGKINVFFQVGKDALEEYINIAKSNHAVDVADLYEKARAEYFHILGDERKETGDNEE